ncbi:phosphocholine cytidylyltransferase family protein [Candidatus Pyrohabitans sp.]
MKGVILAAGLGRRLGKLTAEKPKTLLQVGSRPLISHILRSLSSCGVRDVIIVTGHGDRKLREVVGDGSRFNTSVVYINNPHYATTNNSYSLNLVRDAVSGSFLIVNSDVFFHPGILRKLVRSPVRGIVLMVDVDKVLGEEEMKVSADGDRITDIGKGLRPEKAFGEYIGMAKIDASSVRLFFAALEEVLEELGTGVFYEEAFRRLIESGVPVRYTTTGGLPWIEIDTPEDLEEAEMEIAPGIN